VKPEDGTLFTDKYWLHLAEQLESERSNSNLQFLFLFYQHTNMSSPLQDDVLYNCNNSVKRGRR